MKPINLRIKGLNSFQEEQNIDFLKLTDRGLFGIFGPTGSGKSTVLDGITLALYGNMPRKSSNFINTNCDRLNVSFEFQISGVKSKKYLIDREFKRKKDGNINSGKCKLIDITDENNKEVLADSVKSLNKKVEEIIGLSIDDFTRTVVLPQGKFSEFLKLEGKDRREMLERLFNLEEYGDKLSVKLFSKIKEENNKSISLEGQLKGYEDISYEKLEENQVILKNNRNEYSKLKEEIKDIEKQDKENEELWNAQNELNKYIEEKKLLDEKSHVIENMKLKIKMGESSDKVIPYIEAYENTKSSYLKNNLLLQELIKKVENLSKEREIIRNKWINAKNEKDEKLSGLLVKQQKVTDAIEDEKYLKDIENKLKEYIEEKEKYKNKLIENERVIINLQNKIEEKKEYILNNENKCEYLKIDESFKEKVQNGLILEENIRKVNNTLFQEEEKIKKINILINDTIKEGIGLKESLKNIDDNLNNKKEMLENIIKNCPGDQNILLEKQKYIEDYRNKYKDYNRLTSDINKFTEEKTILDEKIKKEESFLEVNEEELNKLKENKNNAIRKSMAAELRKELSKGDFCPVCGSTNHSINNIEFDEIDFNLDIIEEEIKNKKNIIRDSNNSIIKDKTKLSVCIKNIEENRLAIDKLGTKFREISLENLENDFEKLKIQIENYNESNKKIKDEINKIAVEREKQDGEIKALRSSLKSYQNQLETMEKELSDRKLEKDKLQKEINNLKNEVNVQNFKEKNDEIRKIEIERNNISNEISKNRKLLGNLEIEKETCSKEINTLSEEITKKETEINYYEARKIEKIESIKNKAGSTENLNDLLKEIEISIKNIKDNYNNAEKEKNEIEDIFDKHIKDLSYLESNEKILSDKKIKEKEKMNSLILSEGFESVNHVKNNIVKKEELLKLKEEVEYYKENVSNIKCNINNILNKIDGKSITKNQYEEHKILKESKNEELNNLNESLIKLKDEVERLNKKLNEQKDLLEEKKLLEHKLALLKDLEKLFKGKRFVEFVAGHQLKYISIEASKILKEITNGNYGLEVDENAKFIIRDYKNGGAMRDSSTLSGGETFLASLSLALALSAQIQLKGTAPLELFFLDEGFGTLDDNLLDVVMDSLEKIHNDRLKVGIISHVESIKNRIPVKLIISPSECGKGGSKVKIERN